MKAIHKKLVVFNIDMQQFAVELHTVERVVRIIEITPLPKAPEYIMGVINFHGEIIPVVNVRALFNLPDRDIELTDHLIIIKTAMRKIVLWVDSIAEVVERTEEEIVNSEKLMVEINYIQGIFKLNDGVVFLHDLDQFLSSEEIAMLKNALNVQNSKVKSEETVKKIKAKKEVGNSKKRKKSNINELK